MATKKKSKAKPKLKPKIKPPAKAKALAKPKAKVKPKIKPKVKAKVKSKTNAPAKSKAKPKAKPKAKAPAKANASSKPKVKAVTQPKVKSTVKLSKKSHPSLEAIFTPLDDRLVVRLIEKSQKTAGGLFIPESAITSAQDSGEVLAVGRGHQSKKGRIQPMDVKVGDKILFSEYSASKIYIENQEFLVLREQDVFGIVDGTVN